MKKYYSFTDTEEIVPLGSHPDFASASDAAPGNSVWLFDEGTLGDLVFKIAQAL